MDKKKTNLMMPLIFLALTTSCFPMAPSFNLNSSESDEITTLDERILTKDEIDAKISDIFNSALLDDGHHQYLFNKTKKTRKDEIILSMVNDSFLSFRVHEESLLTSQANVNLTRKECCALISFNDQSKISSESIDVIPDSLNHYNFNNQSKQIAYYKLISDEEVLALIDNFNYKYKTIENATGSQNGWCSSSYHQFDIVNLAKYFYFDYLKLPTRENVIIKGVEYSNYFLSFLFQYEFVSGEKVEEKFMFNDKNLLTSYTKETSHILDNKQYSEIERIDISDQYEDFIFPNENEYINM